MADLKEKARSLSIETRAFIGGEFSPAFSGRTIKKISPADKKPIPEISSCQREDVDLAVKAAYEAFQSKVWRAKDIFERKRICLLAADLMQENLEELALLDTLETGRSYKNYFFDSIPKAIDALRYFAESIDKYYDFSISSRKNVSAQIIIEPIGVVGLITPWNDPLVVAMWKIAPALLMGNSVVVKPAEQSTYSILKVAALFKQAGVPDGVLNIVPGSGEEAGDALARHPLVRGVFFTGSSEVGKKILVASGESNMKKVGLECGGKSAFIVSKHSKKLAKCAAVLAKSIFYNQGQICSAPSRAFLSSEIKDEFMALLIDEAKKYIPGNPFEHTNEVGCVVSKEQFERVAKYIEEGEKTAKVQYHVAELGSEKYEEGFCFLPAIFEFGDEPSILKQQEIFGPVLIVQVFNDIQDALLLANSSNYGLAASIWSDDFDEANTISRELEAGIVHINSYGEEDNSIPFGGIKQSGLGKDKSIFAFHEYSYTKSVWAHIDDLP